METRINPAVLEFVKLSLSVLCVCRVCRERSLFEERHASCSHALRSVLDRLAAELHKQAESRQQSCASLQKPQVAGQSES